MLHSAANVDLKVKYQTPRYLYCR